MPLRLAASSVILAAVVAAVGLAQAQPGGVAPDRSPPVPRPQGGPIAPSKSVPCGAVAYTADGAFGAAYGMDTCEEAERRAVEECVKVSSEKDDCSKGVVRRQDSWFHIQFCKQGSNYQTRVTTNRSLGDTNREAAAWAEKSKFGAENCRLLANGLFHSAGLHTKL